MIFTYIFWKFIFWWSYDHDATLCSIPPFKDTQLWYTFCTPNKMFQENVSIKAMVSGPFTECEAGIVTLECGSRSMGILSRLPKYKLHLQAGHNNENLLMLVFLLIEIIGVQVWGGHQGNFRGESVEAAILGSRMELLYWSPSGKHELPSRVD